MSDITWSKPSTPGSPPLADFRTDFRASLISPVIVEGSTRVIEFLFVVAAGVGAFELYVNRASDTPVTPYLLVTTFAALAAGLAFQLGGLYRVHALRSLAGQISRLALGWTTVFAMLVAGVFFLKVGPEFSRVWLLTWYIGGGAAILTFRSAVSALTRHWTHKGRLVQRAVLIGGGQGGETLIHSLEAEDGDLRICGIFDDRGNERVGEKVAGYPKLGKVSDLPKFSRNTRIDLVLLALPTSAEQRLLQILRELMSMPVDIKLSTLTSRLRLSPRAYSYIGGLPFLDIADRPIANWAFVQKWLFDKAFAVLALVALSPVLLATALAIKLTSKGPVLFKQKRYGFNNELIEIYKFRSMYTDLTDQNAARLVTRDDPRVTRVGRFIRKASIDELPQLLNVLQGSLSLVGPRPHALQAKAADQLYQDAVDGYFARHRVKPGLTGWAQINGWRGETDTTEKIRKRVEHDLYYIDNWSVAFDLYILFKTPFALLKSENAY